MLSTSSSSSSKTFTTLVVGGTGATGKYVVQFLLEQGHTVKVVCRSQEKMKSLLLLLLSPSQDKEYSTDRLLITEASITQVSDDDLKELLHDCTAVISCLGHNLTMKGIWGRQDRRLVKHTAMRLTQLMPSTAKFILMGSDGVTVPGDDKRGMFERMILFLLRKLLPPHADNEDTAAYVLSLKSPEWCIVRPTDLQDGKPQKYVVHSKPPGGLFGDGIATRATVARFMVDLLTEVSLWNSYKFKTPVLHDDPTVAKASTETPKTK